jgi:AAA15 family ATPase/GTPase
MAKLKEFAEPAPFKSLGDGVNHILGIVLSLVQSKGRVLLIDEVENGVHFSMQPRLWRIIFEQARKSSTQVFATTHSWDCVEGFHSASSDAEVSAKLYRLEGSGNGVVKSIEFSKSEVEVARREDIEIR